MTEVLATICTVTGAVTWAAIFVGLVAWTAGIADFGLDVEVEKDDKAS